jgi:hypothetical protein
MPAFKTVQGKTQLLLRIQAHGLELRIPFGLSEALQSRKRRLGRLRNKLGWQGASLKAGCVWQVTRHWQGNKLREKQEELRGGLRINETH